MNRRRLLKLGGAALVTAGLSGRLYAAPTSGPRFLLVFLRGGYDSTNLLIPYSTSYYYEARPNIAIPKPDAASNTSALALDAGLGSRTGGARNHRRHVLAAPGCLRTVCRHR